MANKIPLILLTVEKILMDYNFIYSKIDSNKNSDVFTEYVVKQVDLNSYPFLNLPLRGDGYTLLRYLIITFGGANVRLLVTRGDYFPERMEIEKRLWVASKIPHELKIKAVIRDVDKLNIVANTRRKKVILFDHNSLLVNKINSRHQQNKAIHFQSSTLAIRTLNEYIDKGEIHTL
jgi:hypothetical protein